MGLDDLVPDDADTSSRGGRTDRKPPEERDDKVVVQGEGTKKKIFNEEKFERVKDIITKELGLVPNKVLNNYPADRRYEVFHEAALIEAEEKEAEDTNEEVKRCVECGSNTAGIGVEIEGMMFCPSHTVAQVGNHLGNNE